MILEFEDIEGKVSWGTVAVPPGLTMGQMFNHHPKLKTFSEFIECVTVNGVPEHKWQEVSPSQGQRVRLIIKPGGPFLGILGIISFLVSVVSFFISLFNQPKQRKPTVTSPTYSFEGISDVLAPGDPIPVVYGRHLKGGQVLMYYIDVTPNKRGQTMSMLLGFCEGEIDSIESASILLGDVAINDVGSVTMDMRTGLSSQSVIPGFEQIKNSFFDGREVPSGDDRASKSIIYGTTAFQPDLYGLELQLVFPDGAFAMRTVGKKAGKTRATEVKYEVAWTDQRPENHMFPGFWNVTKFQRSFVANTRQRFFDTVAIHYQITPGNRLGGNAAQHIYVRVIYIGASRGMRPGIDGYRMFLQNVTEFGRTSGTFSGVALLGVRATANEQLHGGRPNATAILRGKKVRQYTNLTSFSTAWSENPAWNTLDYMTNSIYGQGPWITHNDVDIQSFIDFGTLSNSLVQNCDAE